MIANVIITHYLIASADHYNMTDEQTNDFFEYAVARLSAFPNVIWDISNEWNKWAMYEPWKEGGAYDTCDPSVDHKAYVADLAALIKSNDPYDHLIGVHNGYGGDEDADVLGDQDNEDWVTNAIIQAYSTNTLQGAGNSENHDHLQNYLLDVLGDIQTGGNIVPMINDEYGYEGLGYSECGYNYDRIVDLPDILRKSSWMMATSGVYVSFGTGGSFAINEPYCGDIIWETEPILHHIPDLFEQMEYWKMESRDNLINSAPTGINPSDPLQGAYMLAHKQDSDTEGDDYVAYFIGDSPNGGTTTIYLEPGIYRVKWYDPTSGDFDKVSEETITVEQAGNTVINSPAFEGDQEYGDIVLHIDQALTVDIETNTQRIQQGEELGLEMTIANKSGITFSGEYWIYIVEAGGTPTGDPGAGPFEIVDLQPGHHLDGNQTIDINLEPGDYEVVAQIGGSFPDTLDENRARFKVIGIEIDEEEPLSINAN
jgi:hypothetical protein